MTYGTIREEPYAGATLRLLKSKTGEYRGIIVRKGGGILGPFGGAHSAETVPTKSGDV